MKKGGDPMRSTNQPRARKGRVRVLRHAGQPPPSLCHER